MTKKVSEDMSSLKHSRKPLVILMVNMFIAILLISTFMLMRWKQKHTTTAKIPLLEKGTVKDGC